jgi:hypothetical protein
MRFTKFLLLLFAIPAYGQVQINSGVSVGGNGGTFDILSPNKPVGTIASQKNEYQNVSNGATQNLLNYTGGSPGYVSRVWIGITSGTNDPAGDTINLYYDGAGSPSVSIPLQNMFMSTYLYPSTPASGDTPPSVSTTYYTRVNAPPTIAHNYGLEFKLPIPFNTGIKIDLVNNSGATEEIWSTVEYHTGIPTATWGNTRVLHMDAITRQTGIAANAVTNLVNYTGGQPGRFAGLWWMDDEVVGSISTAGASLEGDFALYLDGSVTPNIQSSGTEDWPGLSFYFGGNGTGGTGGGNTSQVQGGYCDADGQICVTYTGATAYKRQGFARFNVNDPITFSNALKLSWPCGDTTQVSFTGTCTLWSTVFYYTQS